MVAWGMTPAQALRAATVTAAEVLGKGGELGKIAPGFRADLIAVRSDPLADPAALRQPALVLKDGAIAADRR